MQITLQELQGIRELFAGKLVVTNSKFQLNDIVKLKKENFKLNMDSCFCSKNSKHMSMNKDYFEKFSKKEFKIIGILIKENENAYECCDVSDESFAHLLSELNLEKIE